MIDETDAKSLSGFAQNHQEMERELILVEGLYPDLRLKTEDLRERVEPQARSPLIQVRHRDRPPVLKTAEDAANI